MPDPTAAELQGNLAGAGAAPAAAAPESVDVQIGDKTFKLAPDVAAAIASQARPAAAAGVDQAAVNEAVKAALAAAGFKPAPAKGADGAEGRFDASLFATPTATLEAVKKEAVEQAKAEILASYNQQQQQAAFWTEFYSANPDLKSDDMIVKSILQSDFAKYKDMSVINVIKDLGTAAKAKVLEIQSRGKGGKQEKPKAFAEGGNHPAPSASKSGEGDETSTPQGSSLSSILKERREARRAAGTKKAA